ncbi:arsenate reductase ArsC [Aliikangiella coralliicola]|uniref:Arsenate reductase ArsC n=1 Tax=Aliikangiella coralliicola TaxID=2592383 RepID=A0A545UF80_9GAMM|nr:arsenate reductase ArsC [Aliikangiella coralliicola]TQV88130.1 arsenate reductase ArsC [Aliikangiella coralliicola]
MKNILFLCTGNSCRSQMAEGFCRSLQSDKFNGYSAGIKAHGLNPYAIKVMRESGIDITQQSSKTLEEIEDIEFDYIVTVCDNAERSCPDFPQSNIIHRRFDDPPALAKYAKDESEVLVHFRQVRDEIKNWVNQLPHELRL